jgi:Dolichyl-phosphate-mannose-protein mannosyltransferase
MRVSVSSGALTAAASRVSARGDDGWMPRIALGAILLGTALLRLRLVGIPLERDEGEYAYMGQLILRGELPYVAAYNMKLPGTYYANAAILSLLGDTAVAIRLGLLIVNLASIVLLYRLGRKLFDATVGASAAAAYAVLALSPSVLGFAAQAEHFVILPMLGGLVLLVDLGTERRLRRIVAAGLLLGLAVLMKQHAAAFVAFGGLALVVPMTGVRQARPARAAAECMIFAVAALSPFGLTCLGMYAAAAFSSFWFWTVRYAGTYAVMLPFGLGVRELGRQVLAITTASPALWLLVAVGATATWWDAAARRRRAFLVLFAGSSLVAICPGWRFSEHYFLLVLPAASLYVGVAVDALGRAVAARRPRLAPVLRWGIPLVAVALSLAEERAYLFRLSPDAISRMVYGSNPFPEAVEIARYVREHSGPTDRVAVIGSEPEIYFYARRPAATGYIYMYPLMEAHGFSASLQQDMIAQIERAQPRFMVLVNVDTSWTMQPDSSPLLLEWAAKTVDQDYEPIASADIIPGEATIYRWGAEARDAQPRSRFFVVLFRRRA